LLPDLHTAQTIGVATASRFSEAGSPSSLPFGEDEVIVTIDGPAGAGKSTAARSLAKRVGFEYLDTGAMYRAVALAMQRAGLTEGNAHAVTTLLDGIRLQFDAGRVRLNGEDVTEEIRTPEITALSRTAADHPEVRDRLSSLQRQIAEGKNIVTEGRDQGTIVFPQAECKFFLVADPAVRAGRRYAELRAKGQPVELDEVLRQQSARDEGDAARAIAPLKPADDAVIVDSTHLTIDQVVNVMEQTVRARLRGEH